jgi:hypothetical protein
MQKRTEEQTIRAEETGVASSIEAQVGLLSEKSSYLRKQVEKLAELAARAKRVSELSPDEFLSELHQLFGATTNPIPLGKQEAIQKVASQELHRAFQTSAQRLGDTMSLFCATNLRASDNPTKKNREPRTKKLNEAYEAFNTIVKIINKGLSSDNLQRVLDKIVRLEAYIEALTALPPRTSKVVPASVNRPSVSEPDVLLARELKIKPEDLISLRSDFPVCDALIETFKKHKISLTLLSARLKTSPSDLSEDSLLKWTESLQAFDQSLSTFERITRQFSPEEHPEQFATIERVNERSERVRSCRALPDWEFYVRCHSTIIKVAETLKLQPELSAHALGIAVDAVEYAENVSAFLEDRKSRIKKSRYGTQEIEWRIAHNNLFHPPYFSIPPGFMSGVDITVSKSLYSREAIREEFASLNRRFGNGTAALEYWRKARHMLIAFGENHDTLESLLAPPVEKSIIRKALIDDVKFKRHVDQIIRNLEHIRSQSLEQGVDYKAKSKLLSLLGTVAKQMDAPVLKSMSEQSQQELAKVTQAFRATEWLTWDHNGFSLCSAYANKVQEVLERERGGGSL